MASVHRERERGGGVGGRERQRQTAERERERELGLSKQLQAKTSCQRTWLLFPAEKRSVPRPFTRHLYSVLSATRRRQKGANGLHQLHGHPLESVDKVKKKNLGVYIASDINWTSHVHELHGKQGAITINSETCPHHPAHAGLKLVSPISGPRRTETRKSHIRPTQD